MIYLLCSFVLFSIGFIVSSNDNARNYHLWVYYLVIVLFWGLSFIDAQDTIGYIDKFYYDIEPLGGQVDTQFEIGYTLSAMLFKTVFPFYWFYQLGIFAIEVLLLIVGLRKMVDKKSSMFIIPLLFFIYPFNLFAFRQGMAAAIFIYAIHFIDEESFKKSLLFFVFILLASFFHQSAFVLALVYVARFTKRLTSQPWLVFAVLALGDLLWLSGTSLISLLDFLFPFFDGDTLDMGDKYAGYIERANMSGSYGIAKVIEINFTVIAYTLLCKGKEGYNLLSFNMMLYVLIGLVLGGFLAHRLNYYWTLLYYVCFVQAVVCLFDKKKFQLAGYILVAGYMIWFFVFRTGYSMEEYQLLFNY